jgi:hypothetical protein
MLESAKPRMQPRYRARQEAKIDMEIVFMKPHFLSVIDWPAFIF